MEATCYEPLEQGGLFCFARRDSRLDGVAKHEVPDDVFKEMTGYKLAYQVLYPTHGKAVQDLLNAKRTVYGKGLDAKILDSMDSEKVRVPLDYAGRWHWIIPPTLLDCSFIVEPWQFSQMSAHPNIDGAGVTPNRYQWIAFVSSGEARAALASTEKDELPVSQSTVGGVEEKVGMTADERWIVDRLADAWNAYVQLNETHSDYRDEFRHAIHRCQHLIAVRVARRVEPGVWT